MCYTSTGALFEDESYPATTSDLIDRYGEQTLELAGGSQTVGEVLSVAGDETFESAEEARYAIYAGLGSEAIGRVGYTDRDPEPPGTNGHVPVSF
ncbi:hypothetical protein HAPAU_07960 [Halalkalicoccus paucihalophilus]|jgi:hypothetical protein|uniref:DUF2795 domain-containing protein n=1 Tax=Halalkalicoccus paucihalophilus TaxID=1008153 RepID=A0A151AGX6_9EURY|nr:hypothetical protein [Halalkalicoccus paucihalophilus]KYH26908.1 hypothetical protein HAPAU_07960 [Halalkalicoccus paucihalophilus]